MARILSSKKLCRCLHQNTACCYGFVRELAEGVVVSAICLFFYPEAVHARCLHFPLELVPDTPRPSPYCRAEVGDMEASSLTPHHNCVLSTSLAK